MFALCCFPCEYASAENVSKHHQNGSIDSTIDQKLHCRESPDITPRATVAIVLEDEFLHQVLVDTALAGKV